jgi:hypothetical protein
MDAAMALLLGPLLYGHIFHRGMQPRFRDLGHVAAESFWRAYGAADTALKHESTLEDQSARALPKSASEKPNKP